MIKNNESYIITYIRVFAMFLIVICHLQQACDNKWAWVFNVGVQVFLAISGWLYGNKNIVYWGKWYKDKIMKLYVPYIIYVVSSYIFYVSVGENFPLWNLLIYIFDLQWFLGSVDGLNHLWFMTAIALCYMISPVLQFFKIKFPKTSLILLSLIAIINYYVLKVSIGYFSIILVYCLAYFLSSQNKQIKFIYSTCLSVVLLSVFSLLDWNIILDYSHLLNKIFHAILGVLCVIIPLQTTRMISKELPPPSKYIKITQDLSYYIYITHHIFMIGPFSLAYIGESMFLNILLIIIATLFSALLLRKVTEKACCFSQIIICNLRKLC